MKYSPGNLVGNIVTALDGVSWTPGLSGGHFVNYVNV